MTMGFVGRFVAVYGRSKRELLVRSAGQSILRGSCSFVGSAIA